MKKFLLKISYFLLILFAILFCITILFFKFIAPQYTDNYQASLIDKVNRLTNINEPKIILIGNSNVAFGIDSEMMEEALNMPVVNLGLHSDLGNGFHEQIAKLNINKGDIIIFCHTGYNAKDTIPDPSLAWITIENHKELWKILRPKDYPKMLRALPNYMVECTFRWLNPSSLKQTGCYSRSAFNEYGDNIWPRKKSQYKFTKGIIKIPKVNQSVANRTNSFNSYCQDKGATLLIAGYPIGYGEFTPPISEYINFQTELETLVECEVISDFTDYFIDYQYFFDTSLHLTDEGVVIRTQQLIQDIINWHSLPLS